MSRKAGFCNPWLSFFVTEISWCISDERRCSWGAGGFTRSSGVVWHLPGASAAEGYRQEELAGSPWTILRTILSPSMLLGTASVGALLVSEQRRRSSSWCYNCMKCSCGWSLLNSASQPLAEFESWTMRLADFIWHLHSFWRINLREKLNCSKLDGDRGHFPRKWRCSPFWMEKRKASQGGK